MRFRKKTKVIYSRIVVPCPNCGHGCEVSLGYSEDESPSSSPKPGVEVKPPPKKPKIAAEISSSESSEDSDSSSKSDTPVSKPVSAQSPKPTALTTRTQPLSSSSDSSESDSDSDSEPDAPVTTAVSTEQKSGAFDMKASSSPSSPSSPSSFDSSESESESDSDSDGAKLPKPLQQSSVKQFFSQFPPFKYDSSQPVMTEYHRMSRTKRFRLLSQEVRSKARQALKDALAEDFGQIYGYDVNDLGAWQSLCRVLRFENVPDNLEGCQQLVKATYVNIVDLIDSVSTGFPVEHFDSEQELSEYTIRTENFISRNSKHAGSLLKFLSRNILDPSDAKKNPGPPHGVPRKRKRLD